MRQQFLIGLLIMGLFSFFGCKSKKKLDTNSELDEGMQDLIDKSFAEFNNRKIYAKLTNEIIDKTADDNLLQTVFDNIDTNFKDREVYTIEKIEKMTSGKQAIFSIWVLQAEVNNGGFNQFYQNSSGQFAKMAYQGLILIGAENYGDLVNKANILYEKIKDDLDKDNDGTIESFSKSYENNPLNELDDDFYFLNKKGSLDSIQINYIRNNKEEFIK